jgi:hypothetical protein
MKTITGLASLFIYALIYNHEQSLYEKTIIEKKYIEKFWQNMKINKVLLQEFEGKAKDLRWAFDKILKIHSDNQAQYAIATIRAYYKQKPNDSNRQAIYSFAYETAVQSFPTDNFNAERTKIQNFLARLDVSFESEQIREKSLQEDKKSPEVFLMTSLYYYHYRNNLKKARIFAEKAVQLDSKWGYAHYKLGDIIRDSSKEEKNDTIKQKMLINSLNEFKKAGELDSKLREGTLPLVHIYTALKDYRTALRHLDIFTETEKKRNAPAFEMENLRVWRAQLVKQIYSKRP